MHEWISVAKQTPEPNHKFPVLVTVEWCGHRSVCFAYYKTYETDDGELWKMWVSADADEEALNSTVVAWMPGPYPYNGN